jgi:large subunit ribosomal protein L15
MVIRNEKKNRKYFGTRRWGVGNIKNARGKGCRGGVGNAGSRKHKFTYMTAKTPELIRHVGFTPWDKTKLKEITLRDIDRMVAEAKDAAATIEFKGCKVLGNGMIRRAVKVKATKFSKQATEKIKKAGGEAIIA